MTGEASNTNLKCRRATCQGLAKVENEVPYRFQHHD